MLRKKVIHLQDLVQIYDLFLIGSNQCWAIVSQLIMVRMQILPKILIVTAVVCWSKCFEHSTTFNKALHNDIDYTTLPVKTTIAPATFRGFISFDKNQLTSRRPPVCQCDQYYSIYTNTCKKKQYHMCGKMSQAPTSSSLTNHLKQSYYLKYICSHTCLNA